MEFKTKQDYESYTEKLTRLSQRIRRANLHNRSCFTDALGRDVVLVSDANDGAEYGISDGELYPPTLILHINRLLRAEGKDLPHFHSDYNSLTYHVGYVCSRDYRFVHDIDSLPETADDKVIVEDPAITEGDVVHKTDRHGHIKIGEFETKCQADDENRHLGDGSIFSG